MTETVQHTNVEKQNNEFIYIQQVLFHSYSFHLCVCTQRDKERTVAAVFVDWIKFEKIKKNKKLFKIAKI